MPPQETGLRLPAIQVLQRLPLRLRLSAIQVLQRLEPRLPLREALLALHALPEASREHLSAVCAQA